MSHPIPVHIWSDIACPWCYIGKRRFERGVASFRAEHGVDVEVEYHSFELAPDVPVDFEGSAADFLAAHKGISREQVEAMHAQITELAAAEGLRYDFAAVRQTKTLAAHRLLHWAKAQGREVELVERLFSAHFEQGRHVGRQDELAAIAGEVGLDEAEARAVLAEETFADAVQQDIAAARQLGITGVPFYVIDGRYGVSGAQAAETFAAALAQVVRDRATGGEQLESAER